MFDTQVQGDQILEDAGRPAISLDETDSAVLPTNLMAYAMTQEYLSKKIERELALAWRNSQDVPALDRLIRSHLRLVAGLVSKIRHPQELRNDLMQEGAIGLMRAAETFDPNKGFSFSTYARWWVRCALRKSVMENSSAIRVNESTLNRVTFFRMSHIENDAENILRKADHLPNSHNINVEISRMMNISLARLQDAKSAMPLSTSLNTTISKADESSCERIDLLVCDRLNPEEALMKEDTLETLQDILADVMSSLDQREIAIIKRRRMSYQTCSLKVLATEFGVSAERIRQIEKRALHKMRKSLKEKGVNSVDFLFTPI